MCAPISGPSMQAWLRMLLSTTRSWWAADAVGHDPAGVGYFGNSHVVTPIGHIRNHRAELERPAMTPFPHA